MKLSSEIMNIQVERKRMNKAINEAMHERRTYHDILVYVYQIGHRDARHDAADIVIMNSSNAKVIGTIHDGQKEEGNV